VGARSSGLRVRGRVLFGQSWRVTSVRDAPDPVGPRPTRTSVERAFIELANGVTSLHPDDMEAHVQRCAALLGAREVVFLIVDIDQRLLRPLGADQTQTYAVADDASIPGRAYRREVTVRDDVDAGDGSVRSWIPIMDSAERLGVLGVTVDAGHEDPETWTAFASVIGETLVSKMAYGDSIIRARRTKPVTLAAEMRWSMLPPLTFTSPRVEISGVLEPAHDIAGDTFDYAVNGEILSLAVLDAMGHGLEASQIATLAVSEYRRGRRSDLGFGEILRGMDEVIASQFGDERFVTGQLAELDLGSGRLTVVNAGHPAPLVFREGGVVSDLPCRPCPPMGLGLIRTEEAHIDLGSDDAVLFHTDGITEARPPGGEQFGRDRLAEVVLGALRRDDRPAEVLRHVVRAVAMHTGGPMADDATAIFLRRGRPTRHDGL